MSERRKLREVAVDRSHNYYKDRLDFCLLEDEGWFIVKPNIEDLLAQLNKQLEHFKLEIVLGSRGEDDPFLVKIVEQPKKDAHQ